MLLLLLMPNYSQNCKVSVWWNELSREKYTSTRDEEIYDDVSLRGFGIFMNSVRVRDTTIKKTKPKQQRNVDLLFNTTNAECMFYYCESEIFVVQISIYQCRTLRLDWPNKRHSLLLLRCFFQFSHTLRLQIERCVYVKFSIQDIYIYRKTHAYEQSNTNTSARHAVRIECRIYTTRACRRIEKPFRSYNRWMFCVYAFCVYGLGAAAADDTLIHIIVFVVYCADADSCSVFRCNVFVWKWRALYQCMLYDRVYICISILVGWWKTVAISLLFLLLSLLILYLVWNFRCWMRNRIDLLYLSIEYICCNFSMNSTLISFKTETPTTKRHHTF